jgi:hypothetical protein
LVALFRTVSLYAFCNFTKLTGFTASTPTKRPKITYNLKAIVKKPFYPKTTIKKLTNKTKQRQTSNLEFQVILFILLLDSRIPDNLPVGKCRPF